MVVEAGLGAVIIEEKEAGEGVIIMEVHMETWEILMEIREIPMDLLQDMVDMAPRLPVRGIELISCVIEFLYMLLHRSRVNRKMVLTFLH